MTLLHSFNFTDNKMEISNKHTHTYTYIICVYIYFLGGMINFLHWRLQNTGVDLCKFKVLLWIIKSSQILMKYTQYLFGGSIDTISPPLWRMTIYRQRRSMWFKITGQGRWERIVPNTPPLSWSTLAGDVGREGSWNCFHQWLKS